MARFSAPDKTPIPPKVYACWETKSCPNFGDNKYRVPSVVANTPHWLEPHKVTVMLQWPLVACYAGIRNEFMVTFISSRH